MNKEPENTGGARNVVPSWGTSLLGWLLAWCLMGLSKTWRIRACGMERIDACAANGQPVILAFWHGHYLPLLSILRETHGCGFTTRSRRGAIISIIARRLGLNTVEIPDSGGESAYQVMKSALQYHKVAGIAVDGPQGPYHRVKQGMMRLASEEGYSIVPVGAASRRKIVFNRWDRMALPLPFASVAAVIGEPVELPADLTHDERTFWVKRIHELLDGYTSEAEALTRSAETGAPTGE